MEIVGVSRNARYGRLTSAIPPVVYMPYDQGYPQPNQMVFALRCGPMSADTERQSAGASCSP
jgi:hypothetical protein